MSYSWGDDTSASWGGGGVDYGSAKKAYDDPEKTYVGSKKNASPKDYGYSGSKNPGSTYSGSSAASAAFVSANMQSAYLLSTKVMDAALSLEEKIKIKQLEGRILITPGQYDHVENVLNPAGVPYKLVNNTVNLDPSQIVLVNCPGNNFNFRYKNKSNLDALKQFVSDGGYLVTTDWALENVIMSGFPGYITRGRKNTADDLVRFGQWFIKANLVAGKFKLSN